MLANGTFHFVTGASGVGKTTLLDNLQIRHQTQPWLFAHFDSVVVPSLGDMELQYGSPMEWQRSTTVSWIGRLLKANEVSRIIFEGQVDVQFIVDSFARHNFEAYQIILLDCSEDQMRERLSRRGQASLYTQQMRNWLKYLRNQAKVLGATIIDTTGLSAEGVMTRVDQIILST